MTALVREPFSSFPANFNSLFIGFDEFLSDVSELRINKYPPFNIIRESDDKYSIELAVAGFSPKDISVTTKNGILTISAKTENSEKTAERDYCYRGLAARNFEQIFKLYEHLFVTNVSYLNGILSVSLERKLPDHLKEQSHQILLTK